MIPPALCEKNGELWFTDSKVGEVDSDSPKFNVCFDCQKWKKLKIPSLIVSMHLCVVWCGVVWCGRSSPVLWRFSKQLKLSSLSESVDESLPDAINSSQSEVKTCSVGSVCLTQQQCYTLPTTSSSSSSQQSLASHARLSEKNIFSSMSLSDNVQPVTGAVADTNELSKTKSADECLILSSSSSSVTEPGSYPASVASDAVKTDDENADDDDDDGNSLLQQGLPLTVDVPSRPVPVTLFCAPTCTISAPVPVALFHAQSCNSATVLENSLEISPDVSCTENSQTISPDVSLTSYSGGSFPEVSVSVSAVGISSSMMVQSDPSVSVSAGGIPDVCRTTQHDPSQLATAVEEEADKDRRDNNVSKCTESNDSITTSYTQCSTGVSSSSNTAASESRASVENCYQSVSSTHLQDSLNGEASTDSISDSQPPPSTSVLETTDRVEQTREVNDMANSSDVSNDTVSDLQQHFPTTKIDCQAQEQNDLSVSDSGGLDDEISCSEQLPITNKLPGIELADISDGADEQVSHSDALHADISHLQQLPITNKLSGAELVGISDGPEEQISDEQIVSQILAAELPLDEVPISHQNLSPVVSRQTSARLSLSDVLTADGGNATTDDTLIDSTEMSLTPHQIQQQSDGGLIVPNSSEYSWMYDDKELQDMLCTLLSSCHVNSTDAAAAAADDDDDDDDASDDDAHSCSSSSTEVYVEDRGPNDVHTSRASRQDSDSDGTVSLLSVVLDGDGLDLMDSAPDGFQTIYSSLVDPVEVDRELGSTDNTELTNGTYSSNATTAGTQPTNLSAFSVGDSYPDRHGADLLLDKERNCSAVMALDTGLVKNRSTAAISSLCEKLAECAANKEDGLKTDDGDADGGNGNAVKSAGCQRSQLRGNKKSCRSSLRMPEKLVDVDRGSPSLACQPPRPGRCSTARHDSKVTESVEARDVSPPVSGLSQGARDKRSHRKHGRKRKQSRDVSCAAKHETDFESASSVTETTSHDRSPAPAEILSSSARAGDKRKKNLKLVRDTGKNWIKSKSLSKMGSCKNPAMKMESCTLRIHSSSHTKESTNRSSSSLDKGQTRSVLIGPQNQQTVFSLEDTRSGSTRTVILNKTMSLPMMTLGKKSRPDRKLEQAVGQWKLNCDRGQSNIQDGEGDGRAVAQQRPQDGGDKEQNNDDLEGNKEPNERKSHKKKKKKKKKTKMKQKKKMQDGIEGCQVKIDVTPKGSGRISHENRTGSGDNKSDNVTDVRVNSSGSGRPRGRPRKKCLLLAQLENSEGYVANSVSQDTRIRNRSTSEKSDNVSHGSVLDRDSSDSGGSRRHGKPKKKCWLLAQLENSDGYAAANRNKSRSDNNVGDVSIFDYNSSSRSSSGRRGRPRKKCLPTDVSLPKGSDSFLQQDNRAKSGGDKTDNGDSGGGRRRRGRPRKKCLLLAQLENSEGYVAESVSQENRTRSRSMSEQSETCGDERALDRDSSGSDRQRKRCLLLAQLEDSEGYVANRGQSVSEDHSQQDDCNSLLWTDSSSLSREERALQVSMSAYYAAVLVG